MRSVPTGSVVTRMLAVVTPAVVDSEDVPSDVVPLSVNVTEPLGFAEPDVGATVAVSVTGWPYVAVFGDAMTDVVVDTCDNVSEVRPARGAGEVTVTTVVDGGDGVARVRGVDLLAGDLQRSGSRQWQRLAGGDGGPAVAERHVAGRRPEAGRIDRDGGGVGDGLTHRARVVIADDGGRRGGLVDHLAQRGGRRAADEVVSPS